MYIHNYAIHNCWIVFPIGRVEFIIGHNAQSTNYCVTGIIGILFIYFFLFHPWAIHLILFFIFTFCHVAKRKEFSNCWEIESANCRKYSCILLSSIDYKNIWIFFVMLHWNEDICFFYTFFFRMRKTWFDAIILFVDLSMLDMDC